MKNYQNKNLMNLFISFMHWAVNNPVQAVVTLLAMQSISALANEDIRQKSSPRKLASTVGSPQVLDSDNGYRNIDSAILTNGQTAVGWSQNPDSHNVFFKVYDSSNSLISGPISVLQSTNSESMLEFHMGKMIAFDNNDFGLFYTTSSSYNYRRYSNTGVSQAPEAIISSKGNRYNAVMGMAKLNNGNLVSVSYTDQCGNDDASLTIFDIDGSIISQSNCIINSGPVGSARIYSLPNQRYLLHYAMNIVSSTSALKFRVYDEQSGSIIASKDVDQSGYVLPLYAGGPSEALPLVNNGVAFGWICASDNQFCVKCFDADYNQVGSIMSYNQALSRSPVAMRALNNGFLAGWCEGTSSDYTLTIRQFDLNCNLVSTTATNIKPKMVQAGAGPLYGTFRIKDAANSMEQFEVLWSDNSLVLRQKFTLLETVALLNPIPNQTIRSRTLYNYTIPTNTFSSNGVSNIFYNISMANGNDLPTWLGYEAPTRTLSGTPADSDIASHDIKVIAYNNMGSNDTSTFNLLIKRFNRNPVASLPLPNRSAKVGLPFTTTMSLGAFTDADGDVLSYNATRSDNSPLSAWLRLNNSTRQFIGTPPSVEVVDVKVKAYDGYDGEAFSQFTINVSSSLTATMPSDGQYTQGAGYSFNGISLNSEASSSVTLTFTLSDNEAGSLTTPSSGSVVSNYDSINGIWSVTGTSSEVQNIANQVQFMPLSGFSSALVISALVDDGVNSPISNNLSLMMQSASATPTATTSAIATASTTASATPTAAAIGITSTTSATPAATAAGSPSSAASTQPSASGQANATPSQNLETNADNNNSDGTSKTMITSIAGSVGGAIAAGFIGLMFKQYAAKKEAAKHRDEHPFANSLRSVLKLNIHDFKSKRGVEYLKTTNLLIKEFEKYGLDVSHFTDEEIQNLVPFVAVAIRSKLELETNCSGENIIPSMLVFKNQIANIANEAVMSYRAKFTSVSGVVTPLYSNPITFAANDSHVASVHTGSMV